MHSVNVILLVFFSMILGSFSHSSSCHLLFQTHSEATAFDLIQHFGAVEKDVKNWDEHWSRFRSLKKNMWLVGSKGRLADRKRANRVNEFKNLVTAGHTQEAKDFILDDIARMQATISIIEQSSLALEKLQNELSANDFNSHVRDELIAAKEHYEAQLGKDYKYYIFLRNVIDRVLNQESTVHVNQLRKKHADDPYMLELIDARAGLVKQIAAEKNKADESKDYSRVNALEKLLVTYEDILGVHRFYDPVYVNEMRLVFNMVQAEIRDVARVKMPLVLGRGFRSIVDKKRVTELYKDCDRARDVALKADIKTQRTATALELIYGVLGVIRKANDLGLLVLEQPNVLTEKIVSNIQPTTKLGKGAGASVMFITGKPHELTALVSKFILGPIYALHATMTHYGDISELQRDVTKTEVKFYKLLRIYNSDPGIFYSFAQKEDARELWIEFNKMAKAKAEAQAALVKDEIADYVYADVLADMQKANKNCRLHGHIPVIQPKPMLTAISAGGMPTLLLIAANWASMPEWFRTSVVNVYEFFTF